MVGWVWISDGSEGKDNEEMNGSRCRIKAGCNVCGDLG